MKNLKIGILAAAFFALPLCASSAKTLSPSKIKPVAGDISVRFGVNFTAISNTIKTSVKGTGTYNNEMVVAAAGRDEVYVGLDWGEPELPVTLANAGYYNQYAGTGGVAAHALDAGHTYIGGQQLAQNVVTAFVGWTEAQRVGWYNNLFNGVPNSVSAIMSDRAAPGAVNNLAVQGVTITDAAKNRMIYATTGANNNALNTLDNVGHIAAKDYKISYSNDSKFEFWNFGLRLHGGVGYQLTDQFSVFASGSWTYVFEKQKKTDAKDQKNKSVLNYAFAADTTATQVEAVSGNANFNVTGLALKPFQYKTNDTAANNNAYQGVTMTVNAKETFAGRVGVCFQPTDNISLQAKVGMQRTDYSVETQGGKVAYPFPFDSYDENYVRANNEWKTFVDLKDVDASKFSKFAWNWTGGLDVGISFGMFTINAGVEYTKYSKADLTVATTKAAAAKTTDAKTTLTSTYNSPLAAPTTAANCEAPRGFHSIVPASYVTNQTVSFEGSAISVVAGVCVIL